MSFKTHLFIVTSIIVVLYLAWQVIKPEPEAPAPAPVKHSPYNIIIAHASWGLNCSYNSNANDISNAFATGSGPSNPLREDNVLVAVSDRCNNKLQCTIPLNVDTLGKDPAPNCSEKELTIEYRCFSYDRPWIVKSISRAININCEDAESRR